ncbi:MAG: hypothetical protein WCB96_07595, partial [Candidatus Aminicenantales bacterium]
MRTRRAAALFLLALALGRPAASAAEDKKPLLRVEAGYIAFSYDHNQFWAYQAAFELPPYKVTCRMLVADLSNRAFLASGRVTL